MIGRRVVREDMSPVASGLQVQSVPGESTEAAEATAVIGLSRDGYVNGGLFLFQLLLQAAAFLLQQKRPDVGYATYISFILFIVTCDIPIAIAQTDILLDFSSFGKEVGYSLLATLIGILVMIAIGVCFSPVFAYVKISDALAELAAVTHRSLMRLTCVLLTTDEPPTADQSAELARQLAFTVAVQKRQFAESVRLFGPASFELQLEPNAQYNNKTASQLFEQLFSALGAVQSMVGGLSHVSAAGALMANVHKHLWRIARLDSARLKAVQASLSSRKPLDSLSPMLEMEMAQRAEVVAALRQHIVELGTRAAACENEEEARAKAAMIGKWLTHAFFAVLVDYNLRRSEQLTTAIYGSSANAWSKCN